MTEAETMERIGNKYISLGKVQDNLEGIEETSRDISVTINSRKYIINHTDWEKEGAHILEFIMERKKKILRQIKELRNSLNLSE